MVMSENQLAETIYSSGAIIYVIVIDLLADDDKGALFFYRYHSTGENLRNMVLHAASSCKYPTSINVPDNI